MKTFLLEILTPKGVYMSSQVEELYLNTSNGYLGVLANHDTLITGVEISPGFIKKDDKKEYYAIFNGVLNIKKDKVQLILSNIEHAKSIDLARAKKARDRAIERINKKGETIDVARAQLALKRALARINSIER